jgi:hypothetical protein
MANTLENDLYRLTHHIAQKDRWAVEILKDKYKGLVYCYNDVSFSEDDEDPVMTFEYDVLSPIDIDTEKLTGEDYEEFKTMIGDILVELIEESLNYHENRESDTESSD